MLALPLIISFIVTLISSCTLVPSVPTTKQLNQNIIERNKQLLALNHWQLSGKIAFIQGKKRQSASLHWQYDKSRQQQKVNLTTIFGINIFQLTSEQGLHTINVDGKTYQDTNLQNLLYSISHLPLPVDALAYWLKGIAYQQNDRVDYDPKTQLPRSLIGHYNNSIWQVSYDNYQIINGYRLATKFTIKQENIIIKIVIKKWQL